MSKDKGVLWTNLSVLSQNNGCTKCVRRIAFTGHTFWQRRGVLLCVIGIVGLVMLAAWSVVSILNAATGSVVYGLIFVGSLLGVWWWRGMLKKIKVSKKLQQDAMEPVCFFLDQSGMPHAHRLGPGAGASHVVHPFRSEGYFLILNAGSLDKDGDPSQIEDGLYIYSRHGDSGVRKVSAPEFSHEHRGGRLFTFEFAPESQYEVVIRVGLYDEPQQLVGAIHHVLMTAEHGGPAGLIRDGLHHRILVSAWRASSNAAH